MKKLLVIVICLILIAGFAVGCSKNTQQPDTPQDTTEQQEQPPQFEEKEIVLFYPDTGNNFLLHEFRKITVVENISEEDMVRFHKSR